MGDAGTARALRRPRPMVAPGAEGDRPPGPPANSWHTRILAHEKQAAEELGQWTEKRDVAGDAAAAMIIMNLNLGRQRVVEEKKAALARGEIWCE